MAEVCTATDTVLVLSSLKTYNIFFECFVGSTSSGPFQTMFSRLISCQLVPPTCDVFIFLKDRLVSQARPFPFLQQRQSHIGYEYWKQSALWNRKGLACETKPTVHKQKHKQKQMQPSSKKHELMVQRSLIKNLNRGCLWPNKRVQPDC